MKTKLMMVVAAGMAFAAQAATETVDGVTYTYSGGMITKVEGDAKVITVPAMLGGCTVTALGPKADYCKSEIVGVFQNNTTVMKVVLPETVTWVGYRTFEGCIALTSVNIPNGVTVINDYTFAGCSKLRTVSLPLGLQSIRDYAFLQCSSLRSLDLPGGLTSIGYQSFMYCSDLSAIELPESVTTIGVWAFGYCQNLARVRIPGATKAISVYCFYYCDKLESVTIGNGVKSIDDEAFECCYQLKEIVLPASVGKLGLRSFGSTDCRVIFEGKPPAGLLLSEVSTVVYPKEFGAQWRAQLAIANISGYLNPNKPVVTVVSSKVRENNPTVLDVVYKVTSTKPTVKVRALAFEDGERTLNKVTRPETFIDGTAANLGDAIAPNVEHKLSWQVSSDFKTDLAKMKFEVLAVEDGILPLEFITIPANGANKKMQLSWNLLTEAQVFDALLWLYADKDAGLTLANGVLKNGSTQLANESALYGTGNWTYVNGVPVYSSYPAIPYVISKMGFSVLSGDKLTYANEMTRLGLSPGGFRQYAWREFDD